MSYGFVAGCLGVRLLSVCAIRLRHGAAFFLALCSLLICAATASAQEARVWALASGNVYQIDAATYQILRTLPVSAKAVAADIHGGAWVVNATGAHRLDSNGVVIASRAVANLADVVATDAVDGTAWVVQRVGNGLLVQNNDWTLIHLGLDGAQLSATQIAFGGGFPNAQRPSLAIGYDHAVYALSYKALVKLGPSGTEVARIALSRAGFALELDALANTAWYPMRTDTWPAAMGCTSVRVDLGTSIETPLAHCPQGPYSVDPINGDAWAVTPLEKNFVVNTVVEGGTGTSPSAGFSPPKLIRLNASGADVSVQTVSLTMLGSGRRDHRTDKIWVSGYKDLKVLDANGTVLATLPIANQGLILTPVQISIPPFQFNPTLTLVAPPSQTITNTTPSFVLAYGISCSGAPSCTLPDARLGQLQLTATLDGVSVASSFSYDNANRRATFTPPTALAAGVHSFSAKLTDRFGRHSNTVTSSITIDTQAPVVQQLSPVNGSRFAQASLSISGQVNEAATISLGQASAQGSSFNFPVVLTPGVNAFQLTVADAAGNSTQIPLTYHYLTVGVNAPVDGSTVSTPQVSVSGSFTGPADSVVNVNGQPATLSGSSFSANVPLSVGANTLTVTLSSGGVSAVKTLAVTRSGGGSGPTLQAPPVDPTVPSVLADITTFLYSGANPVQVGVAPGTIEAKRAAVVRGRVLSRAGQALEGVKVSIKGLLRYGHTQSRSDGQFDMAVNGGDALVLDYEKAGHLPVQRTVNPQWQQWAVLDDVVMVALDPAVTPLDLSAGSNTLQVARGSVVSDADGSRRATVLIPPGTTAELVLPDGSRQALASAQFRATEYTVGPNGPRAMPAPLPPTSGYTYAVELSFDEAIAAQAKSVRFSQKLPVYVENFLNFPVGGVVPLGYYDHEKSAWIPSENGRVIKVLAVNGGVAEVDGDGDGQADGPAQLAQLAITDAERERLGALYVAGQSLWRVRVDHFTTYDHNWPMGPPADAIAPKLPESDDKPCDKPECEKGSVIDAQNAALGESVPLVGTGFDLNYRSSRVPGYKDNELRIPISPSTLPSGLQRIELSVSIAGRTFTQVFPAQADVVHVLTWDGQDAYGRVLQGAQQATVAVGYVYRATYRPPAGLGNAFGAFPDSLQAIIDASVRDMTLWQQTTMTVGAPDARMSGAGGWTFGVHHSYDPSLKQLQLGTGEIRSANATGGDRTIETVAGNGESTFFGDQGLAKAAGIGRSTGVAVDGSGALYIAASDHRRIRKVAPDGLISTVVGNGQPGYSGEGGLATQAAIGCPWQVLLGPLDDFYFSDNCNSRVHRVDRNGILHLVAGTGQWDSTGDGGPAREAALNGPAGIALDAVGNIYIAEEYGERVRRITPDGIISTVAGTGVAGFSGDGGLASQAQLSTPVAIAVDSAGNLFISDLGNARIRRVAPDGRISTVAGTGAFGADGLGGPAEFASLHNSLALAIGGRGTLLIGDAGNNRVLELGADGILRGLAGHALLPWIGGNYPVGDGGPAAAGLPRFPTGLSVDPQGSV